MPFCQCLWAGCPILPSVFLLSLLRLHKRMSAFYLVCQIMLAPPLTNVMCHSEAWPYIQSLSPSIRHYINSWQSFPNWSYRVCSFSQARTSISHSWDRNIGKFWRLEKCCLTLEGETSPFRKYCRIIYFRGFKISWISDYWQIGGHLISWIFNKTCQMYSK